ncbi:MAG TPA: NUDIX domain-containing protein [Terracidiphilus sp.]|nr:NUDIX domain-containing protein [Terracidiphilus sp.]
MAKRSAGILLYRRCGGAFEVFLVHPGGPLWKKKDLGAWSIPKGEYSHDEEALAAAKREFQEETGFALGPGTLEPLSHVKLASGKIVAAWALEGDCDASAIKSNSFSLEWPPRSRRMQQFPEVDRAEWFTLPVAHTKIHPAQRDFLSRLVELLKARSA